MLHRIHSAAELLAATSNDVYVRGSLRRPFSEGWHSDGATAWIGLDNEEQRAYLCVMGEAEAGAAMLCELMATIADTTDARVTAHRPVVARASQLGLAFEGSGDEWEFRWTHQRAPVHADVRWIDDDLAVTAILDAHAPSSSAHPGDAHARRWVGAYDNHGELVAIAADTSGVPGIGHISSVATITSRRGEGWGAEVTSWLTNQLLDEGADVVTLGTYGSNATAIRLYARLGFTGCHQFASGRLTSGAS